MNKNLEVIIKDAVEKEISNDIDEQIEKEIEQFRRRLVDNKDKYISEIMKGIRIFSEQSHDVYGMNYKILFENTYRIEK